MVVVVVVVATPPIDNGATIIAIAIATYSHYYLSSGNYCCPR